MMKAFEIAGVPRDEIYRFVRGLHSDSFSVLGPHKVGDDVEIRVFRPDARAVAVVLDRERDKPIAAEPSDEKGFFCASVPGAEREVPYQLRIVKLDGSEELTRDAYQYGPIMATSICICSAKASIGKFMKNLVRIFGQSAMRLVFILPFGRQTPNASAWWATSTNGMA